MVDMKKIFLIIELVLICAGVVFAGGGNEEFSMILRKSNVEDPYKNGAIVLTLENMGDSFLIEIEGSNMGGYALLKHGDVYEDLLLTENRVLIGDNKTKAAALFDENSHTTEDYKVTQLQLDDSVRNLKANKTKKIVTVENGLLTKAETERISFLLQTSTYWKNYELLFIQKNNDIIYINFDLKKGFFTNEAIYLDGLKNSQNENYTTKALALIYLAFGDTPEAEFAKTNFMKAIKEYPSLFMETDIDFGYIKNAKFDDDIIDNNQKYKFLSLIRIGFMEFYGTEFENENSPYLKSHDYFWPQYYNKTTRNPYVLAYNLFLYEINKPALSSLDTVSKVKWNVDSYDSEQIKTVDILDYTELENSEPETVLIDGKVYKLNELLVRSAMLYYNWGVEYQLNEYHEDLSYKNMQNEYTTNQVFKYSFTTNPDGTTKSELKDTFKNWFIRDGAIGSVFNNYINEVYLTPSPVLAFSYTKYEKEMSGFEGFYFFPSSKVFGILNRTTVYGIGDESSPDKKRYFGNPSPYLHMGIDSPRTFNHKMYNQWKRLNNKDSFTTLPPENDFAKYFIEDENKKGAQPFSPGESGRTNKGSEAGVDSIGFITGISSISGLRIVDINGENAKLDKITKYFDLKTKDNRPYYGDPVAKEPWTNYDLKRLSLSEIENNSILIPDPIFIQEGDLLIDNEDPDNPHIGIVVRRGYSFPFTNSLYILSTSKQLEMITLGRLYNNHESEAELKNKVFNGFSMNPGKYQIRRLIQYSKEIPKQDRAAISWDLLRIANDGYVVDLQLDDTGRMPNWIPNTKIDIDTHESLKLGEIEIYYSIANEEKNLENNTPIEICTPIDMYWGDSPGDGNEAHNIYKNKGAGIEFIAFENDGDTDGLTIARFSRNADADSGSNAYSFVETSVTDNEGALKDNYSLYVAGKSLCLKFTATTDEEEKIYRNFGVRLINDGLIRPGDDFLLRFKIPSLDIVIQVSDGDFFAVYDKKMLWRANLYVDETLNEDGSVSNKQDWNNLNPWIYDNNWNIISTGYKLSITDQFQLVATEENLSAFINHNDNIVNGKKMFTALNVVAGGQIVKISPWTRFDSTGSPLRSAGGDVYDSIAYDTGGKDSPADYNLTLIEQQQAMRVNKTPEGYQLKEIITSWPNLTESNLYTYTFDPEKWTDYYPGTVGENNSSTLSNRLSIANIWKTSYGENGFNKSIAPHIEIENPIKTGMEENFWYNYISTSYLPSFRYLRLFAEWYGVDGITKTQNYFGTNVNYPTSDVKGRSIGNDCGGFVARSASYFGNPYVKANGSDIGLGGLNDLSRDTIQSYTSRWPYIIQKYIDHDNDPSTPKKRKYSEESGKDFGYIIESENYGKVVPGDVIYEKGHIAIVRDIIFEKGRIMLDIKFIESAAWSELNKVQMNVSFERHKSQTTIIGLYRLKFE